MFFKYCWKALLWALFIFVLSTLPAQAIPDVKIKNLDKVIHFFLYACLCFFLITGLIKQTKFSTLRCFSCVASFFFCSVYGGLLELVQHYFILGRTGDWLDFFANSSSAFFVSVILAVKLKSL